MSRIVEKIIELRSKLKFEDFVFYEQDSDACEFLGYDESGMISYLLDEDVLFCNSYEDSKSLELHVLCSDVFAWGCCDCESLTIEELPELCEMYMEDKFWGLVRWVCKKRNLQPQYPIVKDMIKDGVWDEEMEALPLNPDRDKYRNEQ
jgi:hypothetical protein